MNSKKFYQLLSLGIVSVLLLSFSDATFAQRKKRQTPRPTISNAKIYKDIVGKTLKEIPSETTGSDLISWTFAENEPKEIEVLEKKFIGDEARITIKMLTQDADSNNNSKWARLRGNLRLHYERIAGDWLLTEVENLTFKYIIQNSSDKTNIQNLPSVPVPTFTPLATGAFTVGAGQHRYWRFVVSNRATISGKFQAQGGSGNDIEVFILNEDGYINFKNGHSTPTFYNSNRATVGTINITLGAGVYYLVFNNGYSLMTPKAVQTTIGIQYE